MKLNKFTEKGLRKDFPFVRFWLDGQEGRWEATCPKCGRKKTAVHPVEQFSMPSVECCGQAIWEPRPVPVVPVIRPRRGLEEVLIKKVDETFLRSTPSEYHWNGSMVSVDRGSEISFIFRTEAPESPQPMYEIVANAVEPNYTSGSNYAHSETSMSDGETIAHAIERHGCKNRRWEAMLEVEYGIHTVEHSSHGSRLIIWKAGKADQTIKAVIDRLYNEATAQVMAESAV